MGERLRGRLNRRSKKKRLLGRPNGKIKFSSNVFIAKTCHLEVIPDKSQKERRRMLKNKWILPCLATI